MPIITSKKKAEKTLTAYPEAIGLCAKPSEMIPAGLALVAGGVGAATMIRLLQSEETATPAEFGITTALTIGSLTAGAILASNVMNKANANYDYVVCKCAEERRTAEIFSRIIRDGIYQGEYDFMEIVNALDGVSDADKDNLRKRFQAYMEANYEEAFRVAAAEAAGHSAPPPVQPAPDPAANVVNPTTAPAADGGAPASK